MHCFTLQTNFTMINFTLTNTKKFLFAFVFLLALTTLFNSNKAQAQAFCNNELVLWSEDFGTGLTPSSDPNITSLNYQETGILLQEGTYRIINVADQNPNWFKTPDHTPGDVDGKMIVANSKAGDIYVKENTRPNGYPAGFYSVHFFMMNVNYSGNCGPNPVLPQLSIKAEYLDANNNWVPLQNSPVTSALIPETLDPVWIHMGGIFTLPTTGNFMVTNIRFTIADVTTSTACGNDIAIDDIKFSTCSDGGPLPVSFINIAAQKKGTGVNISWSTVYEVNNDFFEVERSNDGGLTWVTVIKTKGSGTSSTTKNYMVYDAKPAPGTNYYRIRQIDQDGSSRYSSTVAYKLTIPHTDVSVLANPFTTGITLDFLSHSNQALNIRLFDNNGKLVTSRQMNMAFGSSRKTIETGNLARGIYILQVTDKNGQVIFKDKLIKQ